MLEILSGLVLILLTMVSYSVGITLAARRRSYEPAFLDLLLVAMLWVVVFLLRPEFSRFPMLALAIAMGVLVGYVIGTARLAGVDVARKIPDSELPEHAREKVVVVAEGNILKRGWRRWSAFAERMGVIQGRMFMGFFYFLVVTPFGLVARLFTDSLAMKKSPPDSNWHAKETAALTIEATREQG
jgi:hypothetical protein